MIGKYIEAATWGTVDMLSMMMGIEGEVLPPEKKVLVFMNLY